MTFHCRHLPQSQSLISAFEHLLHSGTEDQHVRERKRKEAPLTTDRGSTAHVPFWSYRQTMYSV
jgi:hypothetical protein